MLWALERKEAHAVWVPQQMAVVLALQPQVEQVLLQVHVTQLQISSSKVVVRSLLEQSKILV